GFGMFGQGAISEPETSRRTIVFDEVHDAAGVEEIEIAPASQDGDGEAGFEGCPGASDLDPAEIEHSPGAERVASTLEDLRALPEKRPVVIECIAGGTCAAGGTDVRVGKWPVSLRVDESADPLVGSRTDHQQRESPPVST